MGPILSEGNGIQMKGDTQKLPFSYFGIAAVSVKIIGLHAKGSGNTQKAFQRLLGPFAERSALGGFPLHAVYREQGKKGIGHFLFIAFHRVVHTHLSIVAKDIICLFGGGLSSERIEITRAGDTPLYECGLARCFFIDSWLFVPFCGHQDHG